MLTAVPATNPCYSHDGTKNRLNSDNACYLAVQNFFHFLNTKNSASKSIFFYRIFRNTWFKETRLL